MTRTQYRIARRLIRDNGTYALRWFTADNRAVMLTLLERAAEVDMLTLRQRTAPIVGARRAFNLTKAL